MRRDYFDVEFREVDGESSEKPVIAITYEGPSGLLENRLVTDEGTLDASEIDVTYRLTRSDDETEETGVLSVTNRITGDFVLEANVEPSSIQSVVDTAKASDDTTYRIRLTESEGKSTVYDKEMLLVYAQNGSLRRGESLIPGGVEL